jgi:CubicO group peptidase (beta-lactamase class C family)
MRTFVRAAAAVAALLIGSASARAQDDTAPTAPSPTPLPAPSAPPAAKPTPFPYGPPAASPQPKPETAPAPPSAARPEARPEAAAAPSAAPKPAATASAAAPPEPPAARVAGARLQPGQTLPAGDLEAFVDGQVRAAMARDHIAGVTVAVVQNGQVLMKKGYGFASLAPARAVDPDRTLFRLGSLSKTFTWIGLMKEVEAGRVRLDQPVNLYLPERLQVRDQGFDQPIRVVDLMDHTAGFEDRAFGHLFERDPDYVRPLDLYLRRERPRRVRPPGEVSSYSNYGAALAGEAEAWVAGKPFERLMEEEIFLPLGMSRTTFRERRPAIEGLPAPMPANLAADVAEGFHWSAGGFQPRPYEYIGQIAPAGAASSTAGDMARYMLAILGGGQFGGAVVYGPRTAQALRTPILATPAGINGWAHGFMIEPLAGGRLGYGHAGDTLSFSAKMITVPDLGLGVFVAVNTDTGRRLPQELPAAIVREFYAAPEPFPRAAAPDLAARAGVFDGRYLSTRRAYSGLEGFIGRISGAARVRVTPEGRLVTVDPSGPKVWVPEGPPEEGRFVAQQGEERLAFRIADGQASAFRTSANAMLFERIGFWRSPDALLLFAGLAAAAAALTLIGAALRSRRELRESAVQSRASLVQNLQAGLWLVGMTAFGVWLARVFADPARAAFHWPGAALITASACGLVAAALTATTLVALPAVWRGGRRVDSWPVLRRAAFTVTVLIYAVFSWLLVQAGALSPWSG